MGETAGDQFVQFNDQFLAQKERNSIGVLDSVLPVPGEQIDILVCPFQVHHPAFPFCGDLFDLGVFPEDLADFRFRHGSALDRVGTEHAGDQYLPLHFHGDLRQLRYRCKHSMGVRYPLNEWRNGGHVQSDLEMEISGSICFHSNVLDFLRKNV